MSKAIPCVLMRAGTSRGPFFLREWLPEGDEARGLIAEAMKAQGISKVEMARRLTTSRSQLDRLLDPTNASVSLSVLVRAAKVLGRGLRLELS